MGGEFELGNQPGYTSFNNTLDVNQGLNSNFVQEEGIAEGLTAGLETGAVAAANMVVPGSGPLLQAGLSLVDKAEDKLGVNISPLSMIGKGVEQLGDAATKRDKRQIDPVTGKRIGPDLSKSFTVKGLNKLGITDIDIAKDGGPIGVGTIGDKLIMKEYTGQTHDGPEGGIPVDENGTPTILSKKAAAALVENGEVEWNGYVFSNNHKTKFATKAKAIKKRLEMRSNDPASKRTAEIELEALKERQEEARVEKQDKAFAKFAGTEEGEAAINAALLAEQQQFKYGGELPMLGDGDYIMPDGSVVRDKLGFDAYYDDLKIKYGSAIIDPRDIEGFTYPSMFGNTNQIEPFLPQVDKLADSDLANQQAARKATIDNNYKQSPIRPGQYEAAPGFIEDIGGAQGIDDRLTRALIPAARKTPQISSPLPGMPTQGIDFTSLQAPLVGTTPAAAQMSFDPKPTPAKGTGTTSTGNTFGDQRNNARQFNMGNTPNLSNPTAGQLPFSSGLTQLPSTSTTTPNSKEEYEELGRANIERTKQEKLLSAIGSGVQALPSLLALKNMPEFKEDKSVLPASRLADFSRSREAISRETDRSFASTNQAIRQTSGSAQDMLRRLQSSSSAAASVAGSQKAQSLDKELEINRQTINQDLMRQFQDQQRRRTEREQAEATRFNTTTQLQQNLGNIGAMATRDANMNIAQERKNNQQLLALADRNPDITAEVDPVTGELVLKRKK
jgi:hypothetical protein